MKRDAPNKEAIYGPTGRKTFRSALCHLLQSTFPGQFSDDIADLYADKVEALFDRFHPERERMKVGQILYSAVAVDDPPARGKTIEDTRLVPVVLDLLTPEDITQVIANGIGVKLRRRRIARILKQAYQQGGVLSYPDVGLMLGVSNSTVSRDVRTYEDETGEQLPRRGTIHDMGRSVSHKKTICYKRIVQKQTTSQVASQTNHDPEEVEYYVQCFQRIKLCLDKGMSTEETSLATGHGNAMVKEYQNLIDEYISIPSQTEVPNGVSAL